MSSDIPTAVEVREPPAKPELSLEAVAQHLDSLMAIREKAYGRLLHPGWAFNAEIRPYGIDGASGSRRQLPAFAQSGGTYCFYLAKALQPFMPAIDISSGNYSQVWIATVRSFDNDIGTVILKVFQPSLLPIPDVIQLSDIHKSSAASLAYNESSAYETMKSVQGKAVPYFFGHYEVLIPHVEHARVIIMEHIQPGMNLETWCRRYRGMEDEDCQRKINSELPKILHSAHKSASAVNSCNIVHRDINPQNMVIHEGAAGEEVVLVDFGRSQKAKTLKRKREWADPESSVIWIMHLCSKYYGPRFARWGRVQGNLPKGCTWDEESYKQL